MFLQRAKTHIPVNINSDTRKTAYLYLTNCSFDKNIGNDLSWGVYSRETMLEALSCLNNILLNLISVYYELASLAFNFYQPSTQFLECINKIRKKKDSEPNGCKLDFETK